MTMLELPIPRTIEWLGDRARIINQLKLPHKLEFIEIRDWRRMAKAIKDMEIRGAPAIGVAAGYAMALAALSLKVEDLDEALKELNRVAEELKATRPTAVNLEWAVNRVLAKARTATDVEELKKLVVEEARAIQREDEECNLRIGEFGEKLLEDGDTVITICNAGSLATSYYGTATAPIYVAHSRGKRIRVLAMETRPYLQGARLTAWELSRAGIEVKLITDNSVGIILEKEKVDIAFVGADRVTRKGYVANKIGTYLLALACKEHDVPLYVAAPTSSIDMSISEPEEIEIERRSSEEVLYIGGYRIAPEGVEAIYYAFDITPPRLISGIITEKGIAYPPYTHSLRRIMEG